MYHAELHKIKKSPTIFVARDTYYEKANLQRMQLRACIKQSWNNQEKDRKAGTLTRSSTCCYKKWTSL
tara:strand:+ start:135 stop:338 length:204 start_codon:yes stop_codon:yes gene_type:complete